LHENAGHHTVRGVVVDPEGTPVRARIAAVGANGGSYSTSTDDRGRFTIQPPFDEYVLHASTEGGLIALRPGRANSEHAQLELQPGAILVIDLAGREKTRCAIFAQHLRAEDFTLHAGRTARVAVPAGGVQVRLYEGGDVFAEQYFDVRVGESKSASFKLGS
jgi:hypothetical protein